jgi:hypothetical protein
MMWIENPAALDVDLELAIWNPDGEPCPGCGEVLELDVLDYWTETREFVLSTCCSDVHELAVEEMRQWDRRTWSKFFAVTTGEKVRDVLTDEPSRSTFGLDFGLELGPVDLKTAKAFVREHHRHNPPPVSWRWGHGVFNGVDLVGIAMVGRPVARLTDASQVVEVARCCVREDLGAALVWNACSMLYGAARREAKRRGFAKIQTFVLESEVGTSLKAAGWPAVAVTKGGTWNRPSRPRTTRSPTCRKIRHESELFPAA